jgi:hypothetical protein
MRTVVKLNNCDKFMINNINTVPKNIDNFIEKNRNSQWSLDLSSMPRNEVELTKWLFSQDSIGWIEVNEQLNLTKWKSEMLYAEPFYVKHRSHEKNKGWLSCCIHGIDVDRTETSDYDNDNFEWTELSAKVPSIVEFWKNFPVEKYKRLRFMKLEPGGYIDVHNDLPSEFPNLTLQEIDPLNSTVSINVAIDHPAECEMILEERGLIPWASGKIFIINITRNHCVVNNSDRPRIHMIAECVVGNKINEFSKLIYKSISEKNALSNLQ